METVRISCVSGYHPSKEIAIHLNMCMLQGQFEYPAIGEPYAGTVEFYFDYKGINFYQTNKRIFVDSWKSLKVVVIKEFVDNMFEKVGFDYTTKAEILLMIDKMFKNDNSHSTPLMLAAQCGELHTVQ